MALGPVPTNKPKLIPDIHDRKKSSLSSGFFHDNFVFSGISYWWESTKQIRPVFACVKVMLQMTNTCAPSSLWLFLTDTSFLLACSHRERRKKSQRCCPVWLSAPVHCWCGCSLPWQRKKTLIIRAWHYFLQSISHFLCLKGSRNSIFSRRKGGLEKKQEPILTFEISHLWNQSSKGKGVSFVINTETVSKGNKLGNVAQ